MILIADSGATKTDWFVSDNKSELISTIGLNPFFVSTNDVKVAILKSQLSKYKNKIKSVYFYGAGCSSEKGKNIILEALVSIFENAEVEIFTDLEGASRSLFDKGAGIAVILGTGSNSAYYSDGKILLNHPSLGYILGDEGSGSYIGKKFISQLLNGLLPHDISELFTEYYDEPLNEILQRVYSDQFPNRFLASFTEFLGNNISNEIIRKLVMESLEDFFRVNLLRYPDIKSLNVRFTGSISFYFSEIIIELGEKYGLKIDKIEKQPMDGLIKYHIS